MTTDASGSDLTRAEQLLRDEFAQAWNHYRHNEVLRSQYLNYAFSITLATLAIAVPVGQTIKNSPTRILIAGLFVLIYSMFIAFSLASVVKIRYVNKHYADVWSKVRQHFYPPDLAFPVGQLDVWRAPYVAMSNPLLRIQGWAESMLIFLLIGAAATTGVLITAMVDANPGRWRMVAMVAIGLSVMAILVGSIVVKMDAGRKR